MNKTLDSIPQLIHSIRGQRVILDSDLAALYGVATKVLNQAVKRNAVRFPNSFLFKLTKEEVLKTLLSRSQIVTLKRGQNIKYLPNAFTEHGALMAANVLNSPRAITTSISLIEAFIKMRRLALSVEVLARKVNALENKYDSHFAVVFDAVRELMSTPESPKRKIGFTV